MAVTTCSLSSAAAVNCTGEVLLEPGAGEQIFTVRSTVAVHCACASSSAPADRRKINMAANRALRVAGLPSFMTSSKTL